ncbi:MAG: IS3 family transposase [Clostridiales bacterium]
MSQLSLIEKKNLLDFSNNKISIRKQCELIEVNRSNIYYKAVQPTEYEVEIKNLIDKIYTKYPSFGSRRITIILKRDYKKPVNRKRIKNYMNQMGIEGICPKINLSKKNLENRIYPYLLSNISLVNPKQVYSTDITYIGLRNGWTYLVAVMDWYLRYVVSWELDQTLEVDFVIEAVKNSIRIGKPEIFNSDQGSQFTSNKYISILKKSEIKISMDHKGRCFDNIFIERLWRSLKYEKIYLSELNTPRDVRKAVKEYFEFYNYKRPHQSLNYKVPADIFFNN